MVMTSPNDRKVIYRFDSSFCEVGGILQSHHLVRIPRLLPVPIGSNPPSEARQALPGCGVCPHLEQAAGASLGTVASVPGHEQYLRRLPVPNGSNSSVGVSQTRPWCGRCPHMQSSLSFLVM